MGRFVNASPSAARSLTRGCLALAAAGLVLAGCHTPGSSPPSGNGSSSPTPNPGTSTPSSNAGGGTTLFPYAVGDTWVYVETLGTDHGTTTNKVTAVEPVADGHRVTFSTVANVAGLPSTPTTLTYIFHPDGSITVPFAQLGNGSVTLKSGSIVWPPTAVIDSGKPTRSTLVVQIKTAGLSSTVHADVTVKGGGPQSVTVPAGTYNATVVDETIAEKVEGISVTTTVRTWLAPGVGPVKTEVLASSLGASRSTVTDELKSFNKG